MKKLSLLLIAVYFVSSCAETESDCLNGNCTGNPLVISEDMPGPLVTSVQFFGPINVNRRFPFSIGEDNDPFKPIMEEKQGNKDSKEFVPQGIMIEMEIGPIDADDAQDLPVPFGPLGIQSPLSGLQSPITFLSSLMDRVMSDIGGILDLSNMTLSGEELKRRLLIRRDIEGRPVRSLLLSNTRITGLTADSLQPVEDTLRELSLDNCSVPLVALTRLNNLQTLNLSNNGLSTFEWLPQLQDTLEVLDLSNNEFKEVRPELSVLRSLRRLDLSHNKIKYVEENPLVLLPNLEVLSLTMNELEKATFTNLNNIQLLELDWNYLRLLGDDCELPGHYVSLKLASNPWRCDCGLLNARDNNEVLDLDILKCANQLSYTICDGCKRYFLPIEDGQLVTNLTKDSIERLGCTGLNDQFYLMQKALGRLRDEEPEKLAALSLTALACFTLLILAIVSWKYSCKRKRFNRQTWLKVQQIPALAVDKLKKPQEVPYIKIDTPTFNV